MIDSIGASIPHISRGALAAGLRAHRSVERILAGLTFMSVPYKYGKHQSIDVGPVLLTIVSGCVVGIVGASLVTFV